ncbi:SCO6880 family protein [Nocardia sp. NPDC004582]
MTPIQETERRTYGLWTRPRNEGLMGFGWGLTMAGFGALVIAMLTVLIAGPLAAGVVLVIELLVMAPMALRHEGRTGYERGFQMLQWFRTYLRRENIHLGGRFSQRGSAALPGLLAPSKLYESVAADGYPFGMVHMPHWDLYTVVVRCWPQGSLAVDQPMIDGWVGSWGTLLATLGGTADIEAITPVLDTVPETGNRLAAEVWTLTVPTAPQMAKDMMAELAMTLPSNSVRLESWCAITFRATTPERRKDPTEQAVEIGRRLPQIVGALTQAGVRSRPMTADEVTALMRRAWDPAAEANLEEVAELGESHGLDWSDAGPMAYDERQDRLYHDGTVSVTWEMSGAPDGNVQEQVLRTLLEPNVDLPRKRVAMVFRPHSAGEAAKIVDNDYKNAVVAEQSGRGGVVSAAATLRTGATQLAREEQARGHGVTRFSILITITEPAAHSDTPRIEAITKDIAAQSRLQIRRCYRNQAATFAAGLGIGVLLPEMASIPRTVAE